MKSHYLQTTWVDLDGIIPSEISWTKKDNYYMISFISDLWFPEVRGEGGGELD